jgi:nucleoside diphosphate kinase
VSAHALVARHVAAALEEAASRSIAPDVVARGLVGEAVRIFKEAGRPLADIAAELTATAENLDDDEPQAFMRP